MAIKRGFLSLEIANKTIPDIIICDISMPEMNGIELCQIVKANINTSHIPIILLTANESIESEKESLKAGADDYIVKPYDDEILVRKVKELMRITDGKRMQIVDKGISNATRTKHTNPDEIFLDQLKSVIAENFKNSDFSVDLLSQNFSMSKTQLFRKMKALTGNGPQEFIDEIRLNKAQELLENSGMNVSEVAYELGYNSPFYFSRRFKLKFEMTPSDYIKNNRK